MCVHMLSHPAGEPWAPALMADARAEVGSQGVLDAAGSGCRLNGHVDDVGTTCQCAAVVRGACDIGRQVPGLAASVKGGRGGEAGRTWRRRRALGTAAPCGLTTSAAEQRAAQLGWAPPAGLGTVASA